MAHNEQVFTPDYIVHLILNDVGYNGNNVRNKHIIDNSCGDGAFLQTIVRRYIRKCKDDNIQTTDIVKELETYIHGIEIDESTYEQCLENLKQVVNQMFPNETVTVNFDIKCANALTVDEYNRKMDFVVGNPPYCKIHDLTADGRDTEVRKFNFAKDSMTDLYLVFFEIGINMLNKNGILGYITPNSWMTSKAGKEFRMWLKETNKLNTIIQFGSDKVFDKVTTFTNITIINNEKCTNEFNYQFGLNGTLNVGIIDESFVNDNLYLGSKDEINKIREYLDSYITYHKINVKNGFATLNDKLFFEDIASYIEGKQYQNIIDVVKASTGEIHKGIFPYTELGEPILLGNLDTKVQSILLWKGEKMNLLNKPNWYLYGRTQALQDVYKPKIAINNLIKDEKTIKITNAPSGMGVYSGLYIVSDEVIITCNDAYRILHNKDFINYIKLLGKYKNGEYYSFSAKDLEIFINYYFNKQKS